MTPLNGTVVLDLSLLLPGPYCTSLLSAMGAEVWKIERPGHGDFIRLGPAFFTNLNWGKKSVTIDLSREEGRAVCRRLAEKADVFVEGFRPGVVKRFGLDYPTIRTTNPSIVFCSISGFGQEGPYRDKPGHDANYQALSGILSFYTDNWDANAGLALPLADLTSGLFAAFAIVAALLERRTTGRGRYLDMAMTDGLFTWASLFNSWGLQGSRLGPQPAIGLPHYGLFKTRDGKLLALGLIHEDHLWKNLCTTAGLSQWADLDYGARIRMRDEIVLDLRHEFGQKDCKEWLRLSESDDLPLTPVNTIEEALNDPQLILRGLISNVRGPGGITVPLVRNPILPPTTELKGDGPPELGQHTDEVLLKAGFSKEEMGRLIELGIIGEGKK